MAKKTTENDSPVQLPSIAKRTVIRKVPSGEIAIEEGAEGVYLRYDCDCEDALPYCKACCCSLPGIRVEEEELPILNKTPGKSSAACPSSQPLYELDEDGDYVMKRRSDTWCVCNNEETKLCGIYEDRPQTCHEFHCSRGEGMRGWRLDLSRQDGE